MEADEALGEDVSEGFVLKLLEDYKGTREASAKTEIKNAVLRAARSPAIQRYLRYNLKCYCEVLSLLAAEASDANELLGFLKDKGVVQAGILEKDEFYINFFDSLALSFVAALEKFGDPSLLEEVSKLVQKSVFKRHLKDVQSFLLEGSSDGKNKNGKDVCKAVFKFCKQLYTLDVEKAKWGYKLVFHAFSSTFADFALLYRMCVIFTEILGFHLKDLFDLAFIVKVHAADTTLDKSAAVLCEIFTLISDLKIDNKAKINGISFGDFVRDLAKSLMALSRNPTSNCYQMLSITIEMAPLVLEQISSEVIAYAMLADNSKIQKEYEKLMTGVFNTFAKLHRVQNFVSKLVPTLKSTLGQQQQNETVFTFREHSFESFSSSSAIIEPNVDLVLPQSILSCFAACVTNLTSWQSINVFRTLSHHLNLGLVELESDKDDKAKVVYVEILCTLMCWLLLSIHISQQTVPSSIANFFGGWRELRTMLSKFGTILLHREHNHVLMRSYLNLCYHWAEVYITLKFHSVFEETETARSLENYSPSSLGYLHSYLSEEEWRTISQRLSNFGEEPCKEIMLKLFIQELRAILLFEGPNDELLASFAKLVSSTSADTFSLETITDPFVAGHLLPRMAPSFVLDASEAVAKDLLEGAVDGDTLDRIASSRLITAGVLCVVCSKLSRLLRQKRKLEEGSVRRSLYAKVVSALPAELFLAPNIEEAVAEAAKVVVSWRPEGQAVALKIDEGKIASYLEVLIKVLDISAKDHAKELLLLLLLLALHKDVVAGNCQGSLKGTCEDLLLEFMASSKITFGSLLASRDFLELFIRDFDKYEDLFALYIAKVFDSDEDIVEFEAAVAYLTDNLKEEKCLRCATILWNYVGRIKKYKKIKKSTSSANTKDACLRYQDAICAKVMKLANKGAPQLRLIELYACALRHSLAKDQGGDFFSQMRGGEFFELALDAPAQDLNAVKGVLSLFSVILMNKTLLDGIAGDPLKRMWERLKKITVSDEVLGQYSQVATLITSFVTVEEFEEILEELLKSTVKSNEERKFDDFRRYLHIWTGILSCNFNVTKTISLVDKLKSLLRAVFVTIGFEEYTADTRALFEEMVQFEVSIIKANQIPSTAAWMEYVMCSINFLTAKETEDFVAIYSLCMPLMESLLGHRISMIMDRLSPYLQQYRMLLRGLCKSAGSNSAANRAQALSHARVEEITDCAFALEKLTNRLVANSRDMKRIVCYLISDILRQYELFTLPPSVKQHLNNCIRALVSICDQHAKEYLLRVLSSASAEIFKIIYNDYSKRKFTGKA